MSEPILNIKQLNARVEEKEILHDINLQIHKGETHVLDGTKRCWEVYPGLCTYGKSQDIRLQEEAFSLKERMLPRKAQISVPKTACFLSFQEPLEVPGLTVSAFIRNAIQQKKGGYIKLWDFKKELDKNLKFLDMDPSYAERSLNVGFSGGEKKKAEILQLMMLKPNSCDS